MLEKQGEAEVEEENQWNFGMLEGWKSRQRQSLSCVLFSTRVNPSYPCLSVVNALRCGTERATFNLELSTCVLRLVLYPRKSVISVFIRGRCSLDVQPETHNDVFVKR